VIRASWSRTQKHRRKREMRICCKQRLRANSSCICDRVRFLRRRLHSRWGTTTWTRDPLRSQPHKRYTDLCQSYTKLKSLLLTLFLHLRSCALSASTMDLFHPQIAPPAYVATSASEYTRLINAARTQAHNNHENCTSYSAD
jgi:hypothetical protein